MKNGHRPDSRYLQPLAEGRFLEIAEGNDETEFGRGACLELNDEIAAMAKAGAGGALYWRKICYTTLANGRGVATMPQPWHIQRSKHGES